MNIIELSEKRFSARKYTAEPVAQSDLDYIMECVRLAPCRLLTSSRGSL